MSVFSRAPAGVAMVLIVCGLASGQGSKDPLDEPIVAKCTACEGLAGQLRQETTRVRDLYRQYLPGRVPPVAYEAVDLSASHRRRRPRRCHAAGRGCPDQHGSSRNGDALHANGRAAHDNAESADADSAVVHFAIRDGLFVYGHSPPAALLLLRRCGPDVCVTHLRDADTTDRQLMLRNRDDSAPEYVDLRPSRDGDRQWSRFPVAIEHAIHQHAAVRRGVLVDD